MPPDRKRRRFGPLFYTTVVGATAILASMPFWETILEHIRARDLAQRLRGPVVEARAPAAEELARLGSPAVFWVGRVMADPDPAVRILACSTFRRIAPSDRTLAALTAALQDPDATVRKFAADQFWSYGNALVSAAGEGPSLRAVEALRAALGDGDRQVRIAAANALRALGPEASSAAPDLERALATPDLEFRVAVADALRRVDPAGSRQKVVPVLKAMLADTSGTARGWQVVVLLKEEQGDDATAADLLPLLRHPEMVIRHEAISLLIAQCPAAAATRAALLAALDDRDGGVRCEAAFAFANDRALAQRALDVLIGQLLDPLEGSYLPPDIICRLRQEAPASIAPIASRVSEAMGKTPDRDLNAILTLATIGPPEAKSAIPALQRASAGTDLRVAARALELLANLDPDAAAASLPALIEWMKPGRDRAIRVTAIGTLHRLGPRAKSAIPELLKIADEDEIRVSAAAIAAIGGIDPAKGAELRRAIRAGD